MKYIYLTFVILLNVSCNKLLNEKPATNLVIPSTLRDYIALLQDIHSMNRTPALGDLSSDNFYLDFSFWQTLSATQRNAYTWAPNIYESDREIEDWKAPYRQILNANVILDGISSIPITTDNKALWQQVKGAALFFKAHAIYQVAQVFAGPYEKVGAPAQMGVPLRPSPSISVKSERANLEETYSLILDHLKQATSLLDTIDNAQLNWPSRPAAQGLLARTYLSMGNFDSALVYATRTLDEYSTLQNYNQLNLKSSNPFKGKSPEIIFQSEMVTYATCLLGIITPGTVVDSTFFNSYDNFDLRRQIFYQINSSGRPNLKASYAGTVYSFTGLASDEIYLIKAECLARLGKWNEGMDVLNGLLSYRWKTGTFAPITAGNRKDALTMILNERRKELPFRGLRWTDLRRLGKEDHAPTLTRRLDGKQYWLPPGDRRYTLPIPYDVISMSGMSQNPR